MMVVKTFLAGDEIRFLSKAQVCSTNIFRLTLPVAPQLSVTVRVTVLVPPVVYIFVGFRRVDVVPSPKLQDQDTTVPSGSVEVSVKDIIS